MIRHQYLYNDRWGGAIYRITGHTLWLWNSMEWVDMHPKIVKHVVGYPIPDLLVGLWGIP